MSSDNERADQEPNGETTSQPLPDTAAFLDALRAEALKRQTTDTIVIHLPGWDEPLLFKGKTEITLGRSGAPNLPSPDVDLLAGPGALLGVSHRHAIIRRTEAGYGIQDLNSTNGTWLNGQKLTPAQLYRVRNGSEVRLGEQILFVYFSFGDQKTTNTIYLKDRTRTGTTQLRIGLTVPYLLEKIGSYLQAITDLQLILDEALNQPFQVTVSRVGMHRNGHWVEVSIRGANQAIEVVQQEIALLRETHAPKTPTQPQPRWPGKEEMVEPETSPVAYSAVAKDILESVAPDLPGDRLYELTQRLLPHVALVVTSDLELVTPT